MNIIAVALVLAAGQVPPAAPTIASITVGSITVNSAYLSAKVSAGSQQAVAGFQWGRTTAYELGAAQAGTVPGSTSKTVGYLLLGLSCGVTYRVRAGAQSSVGTGLGVVSFSTLPCVIVSPPPPPPVLPPGEPIVCIPYQDSVNGTTYKLGVTWTLRTARQCPR